MRARTAIALGVACSLVVACSIDWTVIAPPHKNAEVGVTNESDGGDEVADANDDARPPSDAGEGGDTTADASDAAIVCSPSSPCPNAMVCTYGDHYCGEGDAGTCVEPVDCAGAPSQQLCGCDGEIYTSRCAAVKAGTDSSDITPARCSTPGNMFRCGDVYCGPGDACSISGKTYSCRSLNGCTLGCACVDILLGCLLGGQCGAENGHLVIKCN